MKTIYRGFELEAKRDKCMAGYDLLYFTIYRQEDGYECVCSYEDSEETEADKIEQLKARVDAELLTADPWEEGIVNHFTDIQGPKTCPRPCGQCEDATHHWLLTFQHEDEMDHPAVLAGHGEEGWLQCKHCEAWHEITEAMHDDEEFGFV